jgi:hypothetical protein
MSSLRRTPARRPARSAVPWTLVADVVREGRDHWNSRLSRRERSRLIALLKASRGRPGALTVREQREFRRLVDQLDLQAFARHAVATVVAGRAEHARSRR